MVVGANLVLAQGDHEDRPNVSMYNRRRNIGAIRAIRGQIEFFSPRPNKKAAPDSKIRGGREQTVSSSSPPPGESKQWFSNVEDIS
jgi:hypothetical protein